MSGLRVRASEALSTWSCSATCACGSGWNGADCSLDDAAQAELVALRSTMIHALSAVTGMQDVDPAALNQQATSLASLVAEPTQLSAGADFAALALVGGQATNAAGSARARHGRRDRRHDLEPARHGAAHLEPPTAGNATGGGARRRLEDGSASPTSAPTLADGDALTAVLDPIAVSPRIERRGRGRGRSALSTPNDAELVARAPAARRGRRAAA